MFTKPDIEKYFTAEKQESFIFLLIGSLAILGALIFFLVIKESFYKGAAIPLLLVGLLLCIVGFTVYRRSDEDRKRNVYAYDMNPAHFKNTELPRMKVVMKNFVIYTWAEVLLLLAGAGLYIYFIRDFNHDFWRGFGLSLAVMAIIALVADRFAIIRGRTYTKGVEWYIDNKKL